MNLSALKRRTRVQIQHLVAEFVSLSNTRRSMRLPGRKQSVAVSTSFFPMKLKAERQNPGARNQSGKSCRRSRASAVCSLSLFFANPVFAPMIERILLIQQGSSWGGVLCRYVFSSSTTAKTSCANSAPYCR